MGGAAVLVAVVVVAALWVRSHSGPSARETDCVIVDDAARQWNTTSQIVIGLLINGAGQPDAYRTVAERQAEAAGKLRDAAGSVTDPVIREHLGEWADQADRYAELHRAAADRGPGSPAPPGADVEVQQVGASISASTAALGELCPDAPTGP
ncbi:hypothetical protein JDV09_04500 [Mycobacterium sp. Y57]|uniref:hypothetical protein n=1 Tax=Mycolicibacterium xanthum TaxID=2796469 RepID=UPI001C84DE5A|nr:hypothetical protein [Mycolicibacterium xanthum]MBX7431374.1 hypothetical protein [Mycolicibacterium xanthum]